MCFPPLTQRQKTIKYVVPNLRQRWQSELELFTANQIAALYEDFSLSDEYGDNDEKLPSWFPMLPNYPEHT